MFVVHVFLWFHDVFGLLVVCVVLSILCCLLSVVRFLACLFGVCCLLLVGLSRLFVVCCMLVVVCCVFDCCLSLCVVCCLAFAIPCVSIVV